MNRSIVRFLISKLLLIEAGLLVVPLIVALIYHEDAKVFASILGTMGILLLLGGIGSLFKPKNYHIYTKQFPYLHKRRNAHCSPLLGTLVLLWRLAICFRWANPKCYRCFLRNELRLHNHRSYNSH